MCEAGLPAELLSLCQVALQDESHPLHPPLQYMIERLATQAVEPKDLRYVNYAYCRRNLWHLPTWSILSYWIFFYRLQGIPPPWISPQLTIALWNHSRQTRWRTGTFNKSENAGFHDDAKVTGYIVLSSIYGVRYVCGRIRLSVPAQCRSSIAKWAFGSERGHSYQHRYKCGWRHWCW